MEQYKDKIADRYISDFKSELNFFEKIMLMPVSKKMEEILKSSKKIDVDNLGDLEDLGFWRKVLGVKVGDKGLFEKLTNKVFDFLKEKQEKIIQAESSGRLKELQELVIDGKLDDLDADIEETSSKNEFYYSSEDSSSSDSNLGGEKSESLDPEKDDNSSRQSKVDPRVAGVGVGVVGGAGYYKGIKKLERVTGIDVSKNIPEGFDVNRTKKLMKNISADLAEKAKSPKISRAMQKSYEKSVKIFEESASSLSDDVGKAFMERNRLGSKLPESSLKALKVDSKFMKLMDKLPDEELASIVGKNADEIKKFFKVKGLNITDDLARQLKLAEHVSDLRGMNNAFKHATKLGKLAKGFKGLGALAVIGMGVDVWVYFETMKEVDAVKKINSIRGDILHDKARMQLGIGVATLLTEAAIIIGVCAAGGAMGGPIGLAVGLAVGAVSFATSVLVDELYYDKKDFYSKNRYDYIQDERSLIKQSIVRLLESDRLGMNESMKLSIQDEAKKEGHSIDTIKDAWRALIYQEELASGGYTSLPHYYYSGEKQSDYEQKLSKSDPEEYQSYLEEKSKMEEVVAIRMEYIQAYLQKDQDSPEYNSMKNMISQNKGIEYIENILANSKVYYYLKSEHEDAYIENYKDLNVEEYKLTFGEKLKSEYPDKFELFEKLSKENPIHFYEICIGVLHSENSIEASEELLRGEHTEDDIIYSSEDIEKIKPNLFFIKKYFEYWNLGRTEEQLINIGISEKDLLGDLDYKYIEQVLLDLDSINQRPSISDPEKVANYFNNHENFIKRQNIDLQVSGDTGQNILYSMAKEFHGYSGGNDYLEIINFYNEQNADFTGIYYEDGWKINNDLNWGQKFTYILTGNIVPMLLAGLDLKFDLRDVDRKNMTAGQVYAKLAEGDNWAQAETKLHQSVLGESKGIKAPIGAADNEIIAEFKNRIKSIIEREVGYRDQKETYERKLIDFIKTQCNDREGYIEIPYDLLIECKKAKIGDVQNYLFKIEGGEIFALSNGNSVGNVLNFDKTKQNIVYEAYTPLRDSLTEEEIAVINKVKIAHNRLEDMRVLQSGWTEFWGRHRDELGIPIELEKQMSEKRLERQKIEKSLLYLSPSSSKSYLQANWEKYYRYFEDTYIGMMATISQFKTGDDLGDINYMNMARSWIGKNIVEVNNNTVSILEGVNLEDDEKYYLLKYIKEIRDVDTNKTAEELLLSTQDDPEGLTVTEQHEKGQWMARQILIAVLEQETIVFDEKGKPRSIGCNIDLVDEKIKDGEIDDSIIGNLSFNPFYNNIPPKTKKELQKLSQKRMEERIRVHLGYPSNITISKSLDALEYENIQTNTQTIRRISNTELVSYDSTNSLLQNMLDTKNSVDWAGRRGAPDFIPNYNTASDELISGDFESWGNVTKIYIRDKSNGSGKGISLKIEGLDITFGIEEGLRMANQINRTKDYISRNSGVKGQFFYGKIDGTLYVDDGTWMSWGLNDTAILKSSTIDKYYPKMKDASTKDKILNYLNSL